MDNRDEHRVGSAGARRRWIPLAIGAAILLLLLIFGLRSCSDTQYAQPGDDTAIGADPVTGAPAGSTGLGDASTAGVADGSFTADGLRGYLGGTDASAGPDGRTFGLDRVTFDTGSAQLDQQDQGVISEVAGVLRQFPNASVTVTGYADPAGDAAANKKLAAQRAVAVKQALTNAGIPTAKLTTNVVGETGGAATQENRRVELLVKR